MPRINLFYIALFLIAASLLLFFNDSPDDEVIAFYGLAISNETKINHNQDVTVRHVAVQAGQKVTTGDTLLILENIFSQQKMPEEIYEITELQTRAKKWKAQKRENLYFLEKETDIKASEIKTEINRINSEISYLQSINDGLSNVNIQEANYQPLMDDKKEKEEALKALLSIYKQRKDILVDEINNGDIISLQKIKKLKARQDFDLTRDQPIEIKIAPSNGLVGTLGCKESEHQSAYNTLLTLYDEHPNIIRGYLHENLKAELKLGDEILVSSLNIADISYKGKVISLGSRVVEIPERLRKIAAIKAYGREILVEISSDNQLLQKEKVSLTKVNSNAL